MGDIDKKPIVMTMPGLDNLLMMYYVVRDKVIKLWSFQQSNPFNRGGLFFEVPSLKQL